MIGPFARYHEVIFLFLSTLLSLCIEQIVNYSCLYKIISGFFGWANSRRSQIPSAEGKGQGTQEGECFQYITETTTSVTLRNRQKLNYSCNAKSNSGDWMVWSSPGWSSLHRSGKSTGEIGKRFDHSRVGQEIDHGTTSLDCLPKRSCKIIIQEEIDTNIRV